MSSQLMIRNTKICRASGKNCQIYSTTIEVMSLGCITTELHYFYGAPVNNIRTDLGTSRHQMFQIVLHVGRFSVVLMFER